MSILSVSPVPLPNLCVGASISSPTFSMLIAPLETILTEITPLESTSNRCITFTFDYQLKSLIYYHTEEFTSAQALLEEMKDEDSFTYTNLVPEVGLNESTFYEASATRGVTQVLEVFDRLARKVSKRLGFAHAQLGDLVAVDGSLMDATLSMTWANYTSSSNKAKVHVGFDLNHGIPRKLYLTDGNGAERPFVSCILQPGQTGVMDRGYQEVHNPPAMLPGLHPSTVDIGPHHDVRFWRHDGGRNHHLHEYLHPRKQDISRYRNGRIFGKNRR